MTKHQNKVKLQMTVCKKNSVIQYSKDIKEVILNPYEKRKTCQ